MKHEASRIANCRRALSKAGFRLSKSRVKNKHVNNLGGYQVIDINQNMVVDGVNFELSIDDIESAVTRLT